ncbi:M48 family metalloprotease [Geoalkalibacter sp.]|uniref:M48 family metalloprotease n=1 Tax=Geoalkalibacter sp. TaxID=3041440 RepID=UPI00272E2500|nr:M48 family metallopeptidase [Geoalkalibacter sp.]
MLTLLWLAGCAVNPVTGRSELALMQISEAEEISIGQKTFPQVLQQMGGDYPDPVLRAYVEQVGQRVARYSHRPDLPYQFAVINDSTPNAFALPGGPIAITRGLLVVMENEAQLASVLGHEVGHVTARHSVAGMQRGALLNVGLAVISGVAGDAAYGPLAQQAGQLAATLIDNTYSREQERESDRLGIDYMVRAGYDPRGAVQLQELFYRKLEGGAEPGWVGGLFRTHPFSRERMLENQAYIQTTYPQATAAAGFTFNTREFQQATASLRQKQKGFELYDQGRQLEARNQLPQAIAAYQQALQAAPNESLIYTRLGLASLKAEDLVPARRYLQRAVELNGNYYESRMGLGFVLLQRGENPAAVRELEQSMKLLPTLQGGYLLAQGYERTGERQKALALYRNVAEADRGGKIGQAAAERVRALEGR